MLCLIMVGFDMFSLGFIDSNENVQAFCTYMRLDHNLSYCLSRLMGKPTICIGENKGADQHGSNCEADQLVCFRYLDSTILLLLKSEISSF